MAFDQHTRAIGPLTLAALVILVTLMACAAPENTPLPATVTEQPTPTPGETPGAPVNEWTALQQKTPFPYTTPLPPDAPTELDGTFAELDPIEATRAPCRRCPPYPPEGGIWKLSLQHGVYRMYHERTGWRTLGSFTVSGDQIVLFNDPHCHESVGWYTWRVDDGHLSLSLVEDDCGKHLRAARFTKLEWMSCQPPNTEAAVIAHWSIPPGCEDSTGR
jgi:hypothetical protein